MKLKLISLAASLLIFLSSFSQTFNIGIKGGASINKIDGSSFKDEFTYGYHLGGFATIGLSKKFAIQPEVLFNQFKTDTSLSFSSVYHFNNVSDIKLNYLSIPILLNYNVSNILALQAGPQFGILLDQNKNLLQNGQDAPPIHRPAPRAAPRGRGARRARGPEDPARRRPRPRPLGPADDRRGTDR